MTTATLQEFRETENPDRENRGSPDKHLKGLIQLHQRTIQTLKTMKEEEKEEGISNGRRKWFNQEIDDLRERIQDLEEGEKK